MLVEQRGQSAGDEPGSREAEDRRAGGVGLDDLAVAGIDDQHRRAGELEEQPVARLDAAEAGIVALHSLLDVDELALQVGLRLQALPDQQHFVALRNRDDAQGERACRGEHVHLARAQRLGPARRGQGGLQDLASLGDAVRSQQVDPGPSRDRRQSLDRPVRAQTRRPDVAVTADEEHDVGHRGERANDAPASMASSVSCGAVALAAISLCTLSALRTTGLRTSFIPSQASKGTVRSRVRVLTSSVSLTQLY